MRVRALAGRQGDVPHLSVPTCQMGRAGHVRQREGQGSLQVASSQEDCPRVPQLRPGAREARTRIPGRSAPDPEHPLRPEGRRRGS